MFVAFEWQGNLAVLVGINVSEAHAFYAPKTENIPKILPQAAPVLDCDMDF